MMELKGVRFAPPFDPTAGTAWFRPIEPRHSEQLLTQLHCSAFLWVGLRERHKCTKDIQKQHFK